MPFVAALLEAAATIQGRPMALREGLGFWASGGVIALVLIALVLSLFVAAASLLAFFDGSLTFTGGSAAGKGFAVAVFLPIGLGYALWQIMKRRARVLAEGGDR
jgi:hypothetical protein